MRHLLGRSWGCYCYCSDTLLALPRRTIAQAAKVLSEELYVKDDHVVLELVQNVDDCIYEEGADPSFQLMLFDDGLLCATNERGFAPANVKAICNLGSSSKSRSLGAFTGEKGRHGRVSSSGCCWIYHELPGL